MRPPSLVVLFALLLCVSSACQTSPGQRKEIVVRNGIDVLAENAFAQLAGRTVGLITNHTGLNLVGDSTAVLLHEAPNVHLLALFSPEHGFKGTAEGKVGDSIHRPTGLPIFSLYTTQRAPNVKNLGEIDTLVFDIQDVGCRFYTYISTMGEAMLVAAKQGIRFVVLDRPNPIGSTYGGSMRDADKASFVAWHDLPVRHGMTVGELARMFHAERKIGCRLDVVKMRGWRRTHLFDATGQTFVNPSPNIRSPNQALLYPGVGLLETTNLSVGRGTDTPFELLGAPWIDGVRFAEALNRAAIPGLRCVPIRFRPTASKYKGKSCHGVRFWIVDRARFDPIRLGIELATALRRMHRDAWQMQGFLRLLANREVFVMVEKGKSAAEIMRVIDRMVRGFGERRRVFLLYE